MAVNSRFFAHTHFIYLQTQKKPVPWPKGATVPPNGETSRSRGCFRDTFPFSNPPGVDGSRKTAFSKEEDVLILRNASVEPDVYL